MNWLDVIELNLSQESHHLSTELNRLFFNAPDVIDANIVALAAALASGQNSLALEISSNGVLLGNPHRELIIKSVHEELVNTVNHEFFSTVRNFKTFTPSVLDGLTDKDEMRISNLAMFATGLVVARFGVDSVVAELLETYNYNEAVLHNLASIAANVAALKAAI